MGAYDRDSGMEALIMQAAATTGQSIAQLAHFYGYKPWFNGPNMTPTGNTQPPSPWSSGAFMPPPIYSPTPDQTKPPTPPAPPVTPGTSPAGGTFNPGTPPAPTPTSTTPAGAGAGAAPFDLQKFIDAFLGDQTKANKANEDRYNEAKAMLASYGPTALAQLDKSFAGIRQRASATTNGELADVEHTRGQRVADVSQDAYSRGLANTTVRDSLKNRANEMSDRERLRVMDQSNKAQNDAESQYLSMYNSILGNGINGLAGFIERRTDQGPDLQSMLQLLLQARNGTGTGAPGTAGGTTPGAGGASPPPTSTGTPTSIPGSTAPPSINNPYVPGSYIPQPIRSPYGGGGIHTQPVPPWMQPLPPQHTSNGGSWQFPGYLPSGGRPPTNPQGSPPSLSPFPPGTIPPMPYDPYDPDSVDQGWAGTGLLTGGGAAGNQAMGGYTPAPMLAGPPPAPAPPPPPPPPLLGRGAMPLGSLLGPSPASASTSTTKTMQGSQSPTLVAPAASPQPGAAPVTAGPLSSTASPLPLPPGLQAPPTATGTEPPMPFNMPAPQQPHAPPPLSPQMQQQATAQQTPYFRADLWEQQQRMEAWRRQQQNRNIAQQQPGGMPMMGASGYLPNMMYGSNGPHVAPMAPAPRPTPPPRFIPQPGLVPWHNPAASKGYNPYMQH